MYRADTRIKDNYDAVRISPTCKSQWKIDNSQQIEDLTSMNNRWSQLLRKRKKNSQSLRLDYTTEIHGEVIQKNEEHDSIAKGKSFVFNRIGEQPKGSVFDMLSLPEIALKQE